MATDMETFEALRRSMQAGAAAAPGAQPLLPPAGAQFLPPAGGHFHQPPGGHFQQPPGGHFPAAPHVPQAAPARQYGQTVPTAGLGERLMAPPVDMYGPATPRGVYPRSAAEPPGMVLVVLVSAFFGVFGVFAAAWSARKAEKMGYSGQPYWVAFGVTAVLSTVISIGAMIAYQAMFYSLLLQPV